MVTPDAAREHSHVTELHRAHILWLLSTITNKSSVQGGISCALSFHYRHFSFQKKENIWLNGLIYGWCKKSNRREKKMKTFLFKALNLMLNSVVQASNTKERARTCHKISNNPLHIKGQVLSSWPPTALQQLPHRAYPAIEHRNHTRPWGDSLTEGVPNPVMVNWITQNPSQWNLCHFQEAILGKRLKSIYPLSFSWSCLLWW